VDWGTLAQPLPMDSVVDHQFVEYALAQLGKYAG
jgi:hypothetical protein